MKKIAMAGLMLFLAAGTALADQVWYPGNPQSAYWNPNVPWGGHTGAFAPPAQPVSDPVAQAMTWYGASPQTVYFNSGVAPDGHTGAFSTPAQTFQGIVLIPVPDPNLN